MEAVEKVTGILNNFMSKRQGKITCGQIKMKEHFHLFKMIVNYCANHGGTKFKPHKTLSFLFFMLFFISTPPLSFPTMQCGLQLQGQVIILACWAWTSMLTEGSVVEALMLGTDFWNFQFQSFPMGIMRALMDTQVSPWCFSSYTTLHCRHCTPPRKKNSESEGQCSEYLTQLI